MDWRRLVGEQAYVLCAFVDVKELFDRVPPVPLSREKMFPNLSCLNGAVYFVLREQPNLYRGDTVRLR